MDHFFQMQGFSDPHDPMLEGYTASAYMAAQTKRIKHGLMVTGGFYRHPGILIKTMTTLDVLSGGRAYFGIGAGWYEREALGLGVPFPPTGERMARLEEILQIAKHMWSDDESPYEGKYYQLAEPITRPQPLSQPHPPILIGGGGEKKTLRFVAQYADACNLFAGPGILIRCATSSTCSSSTAPTSGATTPRSRRRRSARSCRGMSSQQVIDYCGELAALGVDQAIFSLPANVHEITPLERFGSEVIPMVAAL